MSANETKEKYLERIFGQFVEEYRELLKKYPEFSRNFIYMSTNDMGSELMDTNECLVCLVGRLMEIIDENDIQHLVKEETRH